MLLKNTYIKLGWNDFNLLINQTNTKKIDILEVT